MNQLNSYDEDIDSKKDINYDKHSNTLFSPEFKDNEVLKLDEMSINTFPFQKTNSFTNEIPINTNSDIEKMICIDNQENDFNITNENNILTLQDLEYHEINEKNDLIPPSKEKIDEEKNEREIQEKSKKIKFYLKKKRGRKTHNDKKNRKKGCHTKDKEDNIISKIKYNFGKNFYKFLSKYFKKKEILLKIDIKINKSFEKNYNIDLFKKTFKEIFIQ